MNRPDKLLAKRPGPWIGLVMALILGGCVVQPSARDHRDRKQLPYTIHRDQVIIPALQKHPRLVIANPHGNIRLRPASPGQIEVLSVAQRLGHEPEVERIEAVATEMGATIDVSYPSDEVRGIDYRPAGHRKGRVDLVIFVPAGVAVEARGYDDLIHARRIDGRIQAHTRAGSIKVSVWGSADLETESGEVSLTLMKPRWDPPSRVRGGDGKLTVYTPESANLNLSALSGSDILVYADYEHIRDRLAGGVQVLRDGDAASQLSVLAGKGEIELRTIRY